MAQLFANNAFGVLAGTVNGAATLLVLVSGQGARFPDPTNGDYFLATLVGLDANGAENVWEIVKCTGRATDQLTVVRAQESTTATTWNAGTRIELRWTKAGVDSKENAGAAASAVTTHAATPDPHPQYTTTAEASAAAPVQSVASKTGTITLVKADVGLGNVDNTTDLLKPISTATQTALNGKAPLTGAGTSGTWPIAVSGVSGGVASGTTTKPVADLAETWQAGLSVRLTDNVAGYPAGSYSGVLTSRPWTVGYGTLQLNHAYNSNTSGIWYRQSVDGSGAWTGWRKLVDSVDVATYAPSLTGVGATGNWGINAATATKLATPRAINGVNFDGTANITVVDATKEPAFAAGTTAQYRRGDKTWQTLNKSAVGLGNVDNTSDANKPVSTATQTALDATVKRLDVGASPAQVPAGQHLGKLAYMDELAALRATLTQPQAIGAVWVERVSDTSIKLFMRGNDGVARSTTLTLS